MSQGAFAETGLAEPLAGAAAALGWDGPTRLQAAAIPVIRRGSNVMLRGWSGAGVTFAWGAGMLERVAALPAAAGPRALVLCISDERAARVADTLSRTASLATGEAGEAWRGLRIRALATGWSAHSADVLVSSAAAAAAAVRASNLKLEGVGVVVVEHPLAVRDAAGSEDFEALLLAVPRDAQRIFVAPSHEAALDELVETHARRALTIPPRPQEGEQEPEPKRAVSVLVTTETGKLDALCEVLAEREAQGEVVLARSRTRAANLALALDRRGLGSAAGGPAVESWSGADRGTIAYDVPFDAEGFDRLAGSAPLILATPAERAHLRTTARAAAVRLATRSAGAGPRDAAGEFRQRIERAIEEEDLGAQFALLGPLFERHAAEEVAAALSALLRRRTAERAETTAEPRKPAARGAPPPPSFVRLFISAGQRDGLRPADLVGAIAGESGLSGDRIGRIDIRDTFSVAEVDTAAADQVIRALNGTTLRGRSIRVDYDRRSTPGAVRRSRPPRPGS